jgi:hypothetical protein
LYFSCSTPFVWFSWFGSALFLLFVPVRIVVGGAADESIAALA